LTPVLFRVISIDMKKATVSPARRLYRQRARAEASEATARRIMEAFFECTKQRWFDEITLEDVARRADVTVRTVIRRFGGKDGLLSSSFEHIAPRIRDQRTAAPGDIDGAITRVLELYEGLGDGAIRNLAQESRHPALKVVMDLGRQGHRLITAEAFAPWLDPLPEDRRREALDALVIALDVYTWKLLRRDMGRSVPETKAVLRGLVDAILAHYTFSMQP